MPFGYPAMLELRGRRCVVIGDEAVREAKVEGLLAAGADVDAVVDAFRTSARCTTTSSVRSGELSRKTTAVITLVMLAIDRSFCEFCSHKT